MKHLSLLFAAVLLWGCTKKQNHEDKTLFLQSREPVRSLDPALAHDVYSQRLVLQVYEGLLHFHYLKRPVQLEPQLAESMPEISSDGKVLTFKIKKGILFHDDPAFPKGKGREVTANDFIYSWKRLADPKNKSENYWIFRDKIVGYNEWRDAMAKGTADYTTPIEGLQAVDSHTLKITLKAPNYQILYLLATAGTVVVAKEVVDKYGAEFFSHGVGTGPYFIKDWVRNSKITLEANPNYRKVEYPSEGEPLDKSNGNLKSAGERLPLVHHVVIHEISEEQPQWLLFQKRELDLWQVTKAYFPQILEKGQLAPHVQRKGVSLFLAVNPDIVYVGFNNENKFLKNKKLRQAMAMAYNQETTSTKLFNSLVVNAHGPIPPSFDGFRPIGKNPNQVYDVEKAKALLAEAGFPGGKGLPTFKYEMASDHTTARQTAELFKEHMAAIGIKIQIQSNTWPQFSEKIKNKKADVYEMAWNADYPDAENFLQLFYGKNVSPGPNAANYVNPDFDALFEKSLKLPPGPERTALYQQMENIVMADSPWIFGFHRTFVFVRQPWLLNHKHDQMIMDVIQYLDVDPEIKKLRVKDTL